MFLIAKVQLAKTAHAMRSRIATVLGPYARLFASAVRRERMIGRAEEGTPAVVVRLAGKKLFERSRSHEFAAPGIWAP
jgi:hypothetical protein